MKARKCLIIIGLLFCSTLCSRSQTAPVNDNYTNRIITKLEILQYLKAQTLPLCPLGGTVQVTTILANPLCSLHRLEEP